MIGAKTQSRMWPRMESWFFGKEKRLELRKRQRDILSSVSVPQP